MFRSAPTVLFEPPAIFWPTHVFFHSRWQIPTYVTMEFEVEVQPALGGMQDDSLSFIIGTVVLAGLYSLV